MSVVQVLLKSYPNCLMDFAHVLTRVFQWISLVLMLLKSYPIFSTDFGRTDAPQILPKLFNRFQLIHDAGQKPDPSLEDHSAVQLLL